MTASSSQLSHSRRDHLDGVVGLGVQLVERRGLACARTLGGLGARRDGAPAIRLGRRETRSSVATFFDTWNGSVCVVVTVATRPIDVVAGAMRASASRASGPGRRRRIEAVVEAHEVEAGGLRATRASSTRRSGLNSAIPALSRAMPRWSGRAVTTAV